MVQDAPENPPHSHRNAFRSSVASARETMAVVIAPASAPTATPPSSRMRGSSSAPPTSPSRYTSAIAPTAPTNAASGRAHGPGRWSAMAATAPRPAPPDSPSRNGSANGLRTSAWRLVPATPRAPPTRNASTARGSRNCHTIAEPGKSDNGRFAGPSNRAAARVASAAPANRSEKAPRADDDRRVAPNEKGKGSGPGDRGPGGKAVHGAGQGIRGDTAPREHAEAPGRGSLFFEPVEIEQDRPDAEPLELVRGRDVRAGAVQHDEVRPPGSHRLHVGRYAVAHAGHRARGGWGIAPGRPADHPVAGADGEQDLGERRQKPHPPPGRRRRRFP